MNESNKSIKKLQNHVNKSKQKRSELEENQQKFRSSFKNSLIETKSVMKRRKNSYCRGGVLSVSRPSINPLTDSIIGGRSSIKPRDTDLTLNKSIKYTPKKSDRKSSYGGVRGSLTKSKSKSICSRKKSSRREKKKIMDFTSR